MLAMSSTRRDFAKSLAIGAVGPMIGSAEILAQTPPVPPSSPLAKALSEVVRASYAAHLDRAELERVDHDFRQYAQTLERLRRFKLTNADEPDFTFAALAERW